MWKQSVYARIQIQKLSRLVTGQPQDSVIPIETYLCTQCGKALQELLPLELRDKPSTLVQ